MEDHHQSNETSEPRGSPIIKSRKKIKSRMDPAGPSSHAEGRDIPSSKTLLALANILETLSKQQQANMQINQEFLAGLYSNSSTTQRPRLSDIYIASFNPDGDVPIRDWCDHVDHAKNHWNLSDYEICTKIAGLLEGRAKTLGDTWLVKSPVWKDMREALIQTFEPEARYSNDILKLRHFRFEISNPVESITKAWQIWKRVINGHKEKDAVEAVIGCVDNEYLRLRLLSSKCSTVSELISVASTFRPREFRSSEPPIKRPRLRTNRDESTICFKCGKAGHTQFNCNRMTDKDTERERQVLARSENKEERAQLSPPAGHV